MWEGKKLYGFHCDTPEHLHALFYGFDKCTAIKKCSVSPRRRDCEYYFLSISHSHRLSDSDSVSIAYSHPTVSITFVFLIICARFHSLSFIHFSLPSPFVHTISLVHIDSRAIVVLANNSHAVIRLYPIWLCRCHLHSCQNREYGKMCEEKKQPKENTLKMRECVDIVRSIETILKKKILNKIPSFRNAYCVLGTWCFSNVLSVGTGCEWQNNRDDGEMWSGNVAEKFLSVLVCLLGAFYVIH